MYSTVYDTVNGTLYGRSSTAYGTAYGTLYGTSYGIVHSTVYGQHMVTYIWYMHSVWYKVLKNTHYSHKVIAYCPVFLLSVLSAFVLSVNILEVCYFMNLRRNKYLHLYFPFL